MRLDKTTFQRSEYVFDNGEWLKREFFIEELTAGNGDQLIRGKVVVKSAWGGCKWLEV